MALWALRGDRLSELRARFPGSTIEGLMRALRSVRDAMRRGETPEKIRKEFPYLAKEQEDIAQGRTPRGPSTALVRTVGRLSGKLGRVSEDLSQWSQKARRIYARYAVPLTVQKMLEGVEQRDADMIKLACQVFHLTPSKPTGPTLAQQFNFQQQQAKAAEEKKEPPRRASPYFEKLLREARGESEPTNRRVIEATVSEDDEPEESE
jgi:hypothetical protein